MKSISNSLLWFILSFIVFHVILFIMWGQHQEYWYLYTGIMLIAGVSYIFYQRDIESKRLLTSLGIGIITGLLLILLQLICSVFIPNLRYAALVKELAYTGVVYKWQMLVTLFCVIPCHELYMRTVLQKELTKLNVPHWLSILVTAILSASLFFYLNNIALLIFIFLAQLILSISYFYTRRIATSIVAQIVAVIVLLIFNA